MFYSQNTCGHYLVQYLTVLLVTLVTTTVAVHRK